MMANAAATPTSGVRQLLERLWLAFLVVFAVALPLAEAPKNIAAALVVLLWLAWGAVGRHWGGPWDRYDSVLLGMLAVAMLSAWQSGYYAGMPDVLRIGLVAWVVKRGPLSRRHALAVLLAGGVALAVAVAIGAWRYHRGVTFYLQLPSVGHVNQSALYIALFACAAYAWTLMRPQKAWERLAAAAGAVVFMAALLVTGSRAAIVSFAVFVVVYTAWQLRMRALASWRMVAVVALVVVPALIFFYAKVARHLPAGDPQATIQAKLTGVASMAHRVEIWALGIEAWRARPLLGFGPDSFRHLRVEDVCRLRAAREADCNTAGYQASAHAHSLYVATLAERGTLGALALLALLAVWTGALARSARTQYADPLWAAAAAALVVVVCGGLLNTTLRVEHGSAALLWFALWRAIAMLPATAGAPMRLRATSG